MTVLAKILWSKQYTWAPNAQDLLKVTDTGNPLQTFSYGYDRENRLTSASQPSSLPVGGGSATLNIDGGEQSKTIGTSAAGGAQANAQMTGIGTQTETGVPSPGFSSLAISSTDIVNVTVGIAYNIDTDLGVGVGKGGVAYQYSTNGGSTWTSFYSVTPANRNVTYGPQNTSFSVSGITNVDQIELRVQATAIGLASDSEVTVTANLNSPTATATRYDSGTVTVTANGHNDSVSYQMGSTTTAIATALASLISTDNPSVSATSSGYQLTLTSRTSGPSTDYSLSDSWTYSSANFSAPSFTVDAPGSLTGGTNGASNPNAFSETYTIDPWGNQQESGSFNFVQPFSSNNQIEAAGYTYDAAGDLTADALNNTYTYNAEGMLSSMTSPANTAQYTYDALDQRVEKTGGSYPTETIYFQGRPIALLNASSGAYTDLIWAGGSIIAEVAGTQTALPSYRLLDHEGSLVMTTDGSGNVTGTNELSPYGEVLSSNTNDSFSYAGLTQDTEYGGDAATYRNYTTEQLRWTRPDPYDGSYDMSNPQSLNRYVYAMDNPLNNIDPSGLQDENGNSFPFDDPYMPGDATWGTGYSVDGVQVSNSLANSFMSSGTTLTCPAGGCPIGPVAGLYGGSYNPVPGVNGWVWVNSLNGEELDNAAAAEEGLSFGSSSFLSLAPNNPASKNPTTPKSQCVAQVQANAQKTRKIIEAAGGLTLENTTAACLLAGPGAPECITFADSVVLVNTGFIFVGEMYNSHQEEAECAQ